jgi:nitrate/nitrite-specific signal transduction histidine kinase
MEITGSAVTETTANQPETVREVRPGFRGLQLTLRAKLLLLVMGVSLISVLVSATALYLLQRQHLIESAKSSTQVLSNTIKANLNHALLTNDWSMIHNTFQSVVAEGNIENIRILNDQGMVVSSADPGEVAARYERSGPVCQQCHPYGATSSQTTTLFTPESGHEALLNVNLLQNEAECQECHDPANKVLGILMVETPVLNLNKQLRANAGQLMLLVAGTSILLVGLITPALHRYIVQPVNELSTGMAEISAGNLDYQVKVANQDELGQLAESFDRMRLQLKGSHLEMERQNRGLSVLNEVGVNINRSLDLQEVLDLALETVCENLMIEVGLIFLREEGSDRFTLCASRGASLALCQTIEQRRTTPARDISHLVAQTDQPFYVADLSTDPRFDGLWEDSHNRSYVNVPLRSKGKIVGTMSLTSPAGQPIPESAVAVVESVGNQIGMVIENAQLYRQLRYLAVLEERDRLAREMHDDLAQSLGYLNVKASITNDLLSSGKIAQAQESLDELKRVAKFVYTDVRESIFNLRTAVSSQLGFIPTLQDYLDEYRLHYGLEVQLLVGYTETAELPPEMANQLLRVIQEALANVRKHASAQNVCVRYFQEGSHLCVQVEDDGQGFNPLQVAKSGQQHIGLQVMSERMASIGGSLQCLSQPGQGTRIILHAPIVIRKFEA